MTPEESTQLGRIEGKLDALFARLDRKDAYDAANHKDHEVRLRGLEAWRSRALGVMSVVGGLAAGAVTLAVKWINGGGT